MKKDWQIIQILNTGLSLELKALTCKFLSTFSKFVIFSIAVRGDK